MRAGHRPHIGDMHPMQRHAPAPLLVFPTLSNTRRCSCQVAAAKSGRLCSGTHSIFPSSSTKISSPRPSLPGRKPYTGPSATSHTTRFFGYFPPLGPSSSSSAMVFTQPRTGQQKLPVSHAVVICLPHIVFLRQCSPFMKLKNSIMLAQPTPPPTTKVHCGSCRRWSAGAPQTRSFHGRLALLPDSTWRRRTGRRLRPQATGDRHLQRTQPRAPPPPPPPEPSHLPSPTHGMDSAGRPKRIPYKRACARTRQHFSLVAQTERNTRLNIKQK